MAASPQLPQTRSFLAAEPTLPRFRVEVVSGPDRGTAVVAAEPTLLVGRGRRNGLVLSDPKVSRHHVTIESTAEGVVLTDLDGDGGTRIGGHRVRSAFLSGGSRVVIGATELRVEVLDDGFSSPRAAALPGLIAVAPASRRLHQRIAEVAPTDATVLLEGEPGTGKARLAEAIHRHSRRASGPFVTIDCGVVPVEQLEQALAGLETGDHGGAGGTVVLREIGALPLDLQARLARALDARQLRRMGAGASAQDVRLVALSSIDLVRAVNRGAFKPELLRHLEEVRLVLAPLRERVEDIPPLVEALYRRAVGGDVAAPPDLVERIARLPLIGNADEIESIVVAAVGFASGSVDLPLDLAPPELGAPLEALEPEYDLGVTFREAKEKAIAKWTAGYVQALLGKFDGNLSRAARTVAMDRNHLRDLLRKYVKGEGKATEVDGDGLEADVANGNALG